MFKVLMWSEGISFQKTTYLKLFVQISLFDMDLYFFGKILAATATSTTRQDLRAAKNVKKKMKPTNPNADTYVEEQKQYL